MCLSLVSSAVGTYTYSIVEQEGEISLSIHVVCNKYALCTHTHTHSSADNMRKIEKLFFDFFVVGYG